MSAPQSLSLERLLWSWPSVIKAAPAGWERGFALSIAKASKHPGWVPSAKQYERMCQMVADLYAGGDGEVIE